MDGKSAFGSKDVGASIILDLWTAHHRAKALELRLRQPRTLMASQGLTGMPRFFLHLHNGDEVIEDGEGFDAPSLAAAQAVALDGARDILSAKLRAGEVMDGEHIEIADSTGNVLATLRLKDAYRLP